MRASRTVLTFGLFILFGLSGWALETGGPSHSTTDTLLKHARYLASEELMGRGVDTPGIVLARDHIAREFSNYGLLP
ncbi:MAG TPA: hypothetical protein VFM35_02105 [Candidatus Binatia bacterium]|nr:hypothetical protein [Candidatus Binatia bacterium]